MKTILLILLAISLSIVVKGQTTPPVKPVYIPDLSKQHDLILSGITLQQVNDFLVFQQRGEKISQATDLSAKQVSDILANANIVIVAINKRFSTLLDEDKKKWQARQDDSLKAVSAQIKKP